VVDLGDYLILGADETAANFQHSAPAAAVPHP